MRVIPALALVTAASLLAGCGDEPDNAANPDTRTSGSTPEAGQELQVEEVVTGLEVPWGLAPTEDGGLFIGTRDAAEILYLPADATEPEVLAQVDDVRAEGESGLLGLALSPDESTLYAYYTGAEENGVVTMAWDGSALGAPEPLVGGIPGGGSVHQGGGIAVADDGTIYLGTGDNGDPGRAQDDDSLNGKVLRADPSTGEVVAYSSGHRNVEGLVIDDDGRLWGSEFGDARFDELNLVEEGSNYGWPEVEGTGGGEEYVDPVAVWSTDDASPSGIGWWDGSLWLAALRGERLWEVVPGADDQVEEPVGHFTARYGRIRNAVAAADGSRLWVVTSNTDGRGNPEETDDLLLSITR
jgi:glucose/arabinose dehydrogenase